MNRASLTMDQEPIETWQTSRLEIPECLSDTGMR